MNIFILDDDMNIIKILQRIIEDRNLGDVVGYAQDGLDGIEKIKVLQPDIVLVDLLMPGKDGISIVKELKNKYSQMEFIMISQVSSKDMVGEAYKSGVEYYIYKPVNALEVESILKKVQNRIEIDRALYKIQSVFKNRDIGNEKDKGQDCIQHMKCVLQDLGIIGEKGSYDIINICSYIIENNIDMQYITVRELCCQFTDNPKSMEQRIRRTLSIALSNIASLGIEDYMNETFMKYSNTLFNFTEVKQEMDYIRGKNNKGGSVNIKTFIFGIISYCESQYQ
jgi:two-component system response regulator YcbB